MAYIGLQLRFNVGTVYIIIIIQNTIYSRNQQLYILIDFVGIGYSGRCIVNRRNSQAYDYFMADRNTIRGLLGERVITGIVGNWLVSERTISIGGQNTMRRFGEVYGC